MSACTTDTPFTTTPKEPWPSFSPVKTIFSSVSQFARAAVSEVTEEGRRSSGTSRRVSRTVGVALSLPSWLLWSERLRTRNRVPLHLAASWMRWKVVRRKE